MEMTTIINMDQLLVAVTVIEITIVETTEIARTLSAAAGATATVDCNLELS